MERSTSVFSDSGSEIDYRDGRPPKVPRFVIIVYLIVMLLHSFIFYSIWWQIVPFVRDYYLEINGHEDILAITPTVAAQIFLLTNYMTPIFGGLISDLKHTRYHVIFVTRCILAVSLGMTLLLTYYEAGIGKECKGILTGVMIFVLASSSGMSKACLMLFGIEQLDNEKNALKRQGFRRLVFWFYELGRLFAIVLATYESETLDRSEVQLPRLTIMCIVFAVSLVIIPLFIFCKRFYRFNELNAHQTLQLFRKSLNIGNTEVDDDSYWKFGEESNDENEDKLFFYQRSVLRRYSLLIIIFFTFGAYYMGDYFSGIIYPFQSSQVVSYDPGKFTYSGSLIILGVLPILEIGIRIFRLYGNRANFYFIGMGMLLSLVSIIMSDFEYVEGRLFVRSVLAVLSQLFFYPAAYDLADVEAPRTLRGTSTGLFLGLGTFFGVLIYFIWLYIPPAGVTQLKWQYARVICGSIMFFSMICLAATAYLYQKAKADCIKAREGLDRRYLIDSINHGDLSEVQAGTPQST